MNQTTVVRCDDFEVSGLGAAPQWQKASWLPLSPVSGASAYRTRAKLLYSTQGLYFLVECEDRKLTCAMTRDNSDIFTEDVVEVFLWPSPSQRVYFEYEISPLNVELPIMVVNNGGSFFGWLPWHYEGNRMVRRRTTIQGGEQKPHASVQGWTTEFFIPFALFQGVTTTPPVPGARWRANLYRIDYDDNQTNHWAWNPETKTNFHLIEQFGELVFGE